MDNAEFILSIGSLEIKEVVKIFISKYLEFQCASKLSYKLQITESFTSRPLTHAHIWLDNISKTICDWLTVAMFESPAV